MKKRNAVYFVLTPLLLLMLTGLSFGQDNKIITGEIIKFHSKILNENVSLYISLPDRYSADTLQKYPVMYMLDGSMQFLYSPGIVKYYNIKNKMPQLIIVGVLSSDRTRDYTPPSSVQNDIKNNPTGGGADKYLSFLTDELEPYINKAYRTEKFKILSGWSFGGLFAIYALLNRPESFDAYIAASPSVWWNGESETKKCEQYFSKNKLSNKYLFFTDGGLEHPGMILTIKHFADMLGTNAPLSLKWKFCFLPDADHDLTPIPTLYNGLQFIFQKWGYTPQPGWRERSASDLKASIEKHFDSLSVQYGYECKPSESIINIHGYGFLAGKKFSDAIVMFLYNVKLYPESWNAYDSLSEAYAKAGNKELAIKNYEKSLKLNPESQSGKKALKQLKESM